MNCMVLSINIGNVDLVMVSVVALEVGNIVDGEHYAEINLGDLPGWVPWTKKSLDA